MLTGEQSHDPIAKTKCRDGENSLSDDAGNAEWQYAALLTMIMSPTSSVGIESISEGAVNLRDSRATNAPETCIVSVTTLVKGWDIAFGWSIDDPSGFSFRP